MWEGSAKENPMSIPQIPAFCAPALTDVRRTALEQFYCALATRNFDLVDGALTEHWEDIPLAPGQTPGPAGIKSIFGKLSVAFPDIALEIVDALAEGDRAAVRVECTATHRGDLFGVPASGKTVRFNLHEFHQFEGARIRRTWHMEDLFGLFAQIGSWPAPALRPRPDDYAASFLTLDLARAADDVPSSDSPYPTSRTMR